MRKFLDKVKMFFSKLKGIVLKHKLISICVLAVFTTIITLAIVLPIVVFPSSSYDKSRERFKQYSFELIEIKQNAVDEYEFSVALPGGRTNDVRFYLTSRDVVSEDGLISDLSFSDGLYSFKTDKSFGDYFLWAVSPTGEASMQITIPKAEPYVLETEKDGRAVNQIFFEVDSDLSWSGFIDPKGKNVYRSSKLVFDSSARAVALNLDIESDRDTIDLSPELSEPYYYTVFEGKNGKVKYISYPILSSKTVFVSTPKAELISGGMLKITATKRQAEQDFELNLRGKDKLGRIIYSKSVADLSDASSKINMQIDIRDLNIAETWYDINIVSKKSGQAFGIISSIQDCMEDTVSGKRFRFENWQGILKVAFSPYTDEVFMDSYKLEMEGADEDAYPALVITGAFKEGSTLTSEDINLVIDYDSPDGIVFVASVEAVDDGEGGFSVCFNLRGLNALEIWHNLSFQIDGINYKILIDHEPNKKLEADERDYALNESRGYLKVSFLRQASN